MGVNMSRTAYKWFVVMAFLGIFTSIGATNQVISTRLSASDIKSPRNGSVTLTLRNADGAPVINSTVNYAQTSHDFLFGVGMSGPGGVLPYELYPDFAKIGVNYVLPLFLWADVEPDPGLYRWNGIDNYRIPDLHQLGFTIQGQLLIFFFDQSWCLPEYVKSMGFDELNQAVYKHVFDVVHQYRGQVTFWTINEPGDPRSSYFKFSQDQWVKIVQSAGQAIRDADPNAQIFVNIVVDDHDGYSPTQFLDALVNQGVAFDAIGLEIYPGMVASDENGYPSIIATQEKILSFARFGKPIIITEIAVPEKPSREAQANWLRSFYEMAVEIPAVKGIVWFYVVDDQGGGELATAGLFPDANSAPRPIYQTLADVIRERTTTGTSKTDSNGKVVIEGYAGDYQISVEDGVRTTSFSIHVSEGENSSVILSAPTLTPTVTPLQLNTPTAIMTPQPQQQDSTWIGFVIAGVFGIALAFGIFRLLLRRHR
jgi:endo-1,4-beta-xylanase